MLFNVLIRPDFDRLKSIGVNPSTLMDPHARARISPAVFRQAEGVISHGLTWVFVTMLAFAVIGLLVTLLMPAQKCDHAVTAAEALETMGA